jgi:hypothetical protein
MMGKNIISMKSCLNPNGPCCDWKCELCVYHVSHNISGIDSEVFEEEKEKKETGRFDLINLE